MKKILLVLGLLATIAFFYYCLSRHSVEIQNDIQTRLTALYDQRGGLPDGIKFEVSGRDVTLTGPADDQNTIEQIELLARQLDGVRVVKNNLQLPQSEKEIIIEDDPLAGLVPIPQIEEEAPALLEETNDNSDLSLPMPSLEIPTIDMNIENDTLAIENGDQEGVIDLEVDEQMASDLGEAPIAAEENIIIVETEAPVIPQAPAPPEDILAVEEPIQTVHPCQQKMANILENKRIEFQTGNAKLLRSSIPTLDRIVSEAKKCEGTVIDIHGHTDATGNEDANRLLSLNRAKAVGYYLINKGVTQKIGAYGHGSAQPIASNNTDVGRAKNRRVEFNVYKQQ